jgi:hypothetical protein
MRIGSHIARLNCDQHVRVCRYLQMVDASEPVRIEFSWLAPASPEAASPASAKVVMMAVLTFAVSLFGTPFLRSEPARLPPWRVRCRALFGATANCREAIGDKRI